MGQKHTLDKLNSMNREELITIILTMQGQLDALNENIEKLIEQVRIANQNRFGRSTETLKSIEGQMSFLMKLTPFMTKTLLNQRQMKYFRSSHAKRKQKVSVTLILKISRKRCSRLMLFQRKH